MKNYLWVVGDPEDTVMYPFMCAVSGGSLPQAVQGWERQWSCCSKYLKWAINHELCHRHIKWWRWKHWKAKWLCGGDIMNPRLILLMERSVMDNTNIIKCQITTSLTFLSTYIFPKNISWNFKIWNTFSSRGTVTHGDGSKI